MFFGRLSGPAGAPHIPAPALRAGDTPGPRRHGGQLGASAGRRPGGLAALVALLGGMGREGIPCLGRDGRGQPRPPRTLGLHVEPLGHPSATREKRGGDYTLASHGFGQIEV